MTSSFASALAAPLRNVQALVGPGWSGPDPATAFRSVRDRLDEVADATERAWVQASAQWNGSAASRAEQFAHSTVVAIAAMSMTAGQFGDHTEQAAAAVGQRSRWMAAGMSQSPWWSVLSRRVCGEGRGR